MMRFIAFAALLTVGLSAAAQDSVRVRAGDHDAYTRLVIDWAAPVAYRSEREPGGSTVTITFETEALFDLAAVDRGSWSRLVSARQLGSDPAVLEIDAGAPVAPRIFELGSRLVIDLYEGDAAPLQQADRPAEASEAVTEQGPETIAEEALSDPIPLLREARAAVETPSGAANTGARIVLNPPSPVALAVYRRNGALWLVVDAAMTGIPPAIVGPQANRVGTPQRFTVDGGTLFRIDVPPDLAATVRRDGLSWQVLLSDQAVAAETVNARVQRFGRDAPGVLLEAAGLGPRIAFFDPDVGDRIIALPRLETSPMPIAERRFVDFDLMSSAAGMVLRPERETVRFEIRDDGVLVSAPGGLRLNRTLLEAEAPTTKEVAGTAVAENRLFALDVWHGDPAAAFPEKRIAGETVLRAAENDSQRVRAHLGLARLYIAHGFAHEALAHLGLARAVMADVAASPDVIALAGVGKILAGFPQQGLDDLDEPAFQAVPETAIWRGYAHALLGEWPEAHESFENGAFLLDRYPGELAERISIQAAEAALRNGNIVAAQDHLDRIDMLHDRQRPDRRGRAALNFLRGELMRQTGDNRRAIRHWQAAAKQGDRLYRVRAELALTELQSASDELTPAEAAEKLEGLRFAWRGDAMETAIGEALGGMYMEAGNPREGFDVLRGTAARAAPEAAAAIAEKMRSEFARLFVEGEADALSPVVAYALYRDFEELAPRGADQVRAGRQLAERLVEIDLLDHAAALLTDVMDEDGAQRLAVGARLAAVHLLNRNPQEALDVLDALGEGDDTFAEGLRLLRARSLSELGRTEDALTVLDGLSSLEADRLRADVLWAAERWDQAAEALAALMPSLESGALSEADAQLVLKQAVALTLADDGATLDELSDRYAGAMEQTAQANAFRVLTSSVQRGLQINRDTIAASVARIDLFKEFLAGFGVAKSPA